MADHQPAFKEFTGLFVAATCVMSFIGIGFVKVAVFVFAGVDANFSPAWEAAMLSLSSAALGYLIGRSPGSVVPVLPDVILDNNGSSAKITSGDTNPPKE